MVSLVPNEPDEIRNGSQVILSVFVQFAEEDRVQWLRPIIITIIQNTKSLSTTLQVSNCLVCVREELNVITEIHNQSELSVIVPEDAMGENIVH